MEERLQKILSQRGVASRRHAESMILAGRVQINGDVAHLGQKANPASDVITVDGEILKVNSRPNLVYLLLHKPLGVVSTCYDPEGRATVVDLLKQLRPGQGIHPVGRLDVNSTGALILTNDGDLTFELTHPSHDIPKTYQVWLQGHPPESVLEEWRQGVVLDGRKTRLAQVRVLEEKTNTVCLEIILQEGRNRQIRRVAQKLGYPVLELHRTAIGSIQLQLPGKLLAPGDYRYLEDFEISFLQKTNQLPIV